MVPSRTMRHSNAQRRTTDPQLLARSGARAATCSQPGTCMPSVPAAAPVMRPSPALYAPSGPAPGGKLLRPGGNTAAAAGPRPPLASDRAAALAAVAPLGALHQNDVRTPAGGGRVAVGLVRTLAVARDLHLAGGTLSHIETGLGLVRAVGALTPVIGVQVIAGDLIVATTPARLVEPETVTMDIAGLLLRFLIS